MAVKRPKATCAIYTRKSSEEGLDQAFNSLDAQREAGEAFIHSQTHEGWRVLSDRYDDGGISGATMERPALKRLLADIEAGKIDVVVVYKVDRLTRALSDFAKMIEIFDRHGVSFVSVTQQFNTTTSMGRLTLNVLLSFAQFEREVTGERIRDKIRASKAKGMWMGGRPPLGFDVRDRKLVVNPGEAKQVRWIFRRYLDLGAINRLRSDVVSQDITSKVYTSKAGISSGGGPFGRSALHRLLGNHLYVGEVAHRGNVYLGEHEAIVDRELWDKVQALLAEKRQCEHAGPSTRQVSLLKGLIVDASERRLTPIHATKNGKRYRYYVSNCIVSGSICGADDRTWRIPAHEIEQLAISQIKDLLRDRSRLYDVLKAVDASLATAEATYDHLAEVADRWDELVHRDQRIILRHLLSRVTIADDQVEVHVRPDAIAHIGVSGADSLIAARPDGRGRTEPVVLTVPARLTRRGRELKLIVTGEEVDGRLPDTDLMVAVARARHWLDLLMTGKVASIRDLALSERKLERHIGQHLRLAFLAPDIVEAILDGRQPPELSLRKLVRTDPPLEWGEQRRRLGFAG